jgi:hypothetical protein
VEDRKKYLQNIIEAKRKPMLRVDYSVQDVWERRTKRRDGIRKVLAAKQAPCDSKK